MSRKILTDSGNCEYASMLHFFDNSNSRAKRHGIADADAAVGKVEIFIRFLHDFLL